MVLNMPNPIIIAAKIANGTKMNKLVLRPTVEMKVQGIKLSASFDNNGKCADSFWIL
jgi:hypothetical protein